MKIRLQIQGELDASNSNKKYRGLIHGFFQILKEEKVKGLYKGK